MRKVTKGHWAEFAKLRGNRSISSWNAKISREPFLTEMSWLRSSPKKRAFPHMTFSNASISMPKMSASIFLGIHLGTTFPLISRVPARTHGWRRDARRRVPSDPLARGEQTSRFAQALRSHRNLAKPTHEQWQWIALTDTTSTPWWSSVSWPSLIGRNACCQMSCVHWRRSNNSCRRVDRHFILQRASGNEHILAAASLSFSTWRASPTSRSWQVAWNRVSAFSSEGGVKDDRLDAWSFAESSCRRLRVTEVAL